MALILLALALASYALAAVFYSRYIPEQNVPLIVADSILLGLAVGMVYKVVATLVSLKVRQPPGSPLPS